MKKVSDLVSICELIMTEDEISKDVIIKNCFEKTKIYRYISIEGEQEEK